MLGSTVGCPRDELLRERPGDRGRPLDSEINYRAGIAALARRPKIEIEENCKAFRNFL